MENQQGFSVVKIENGKLIDQIKNKKQKDWMKVCKKLGLVVETKYGKGSHVGVYRPECPIENKQCCVVPLPQEIYPNIQRDIFKKVLYYGIDSGKYTEKDIWKALGVKVK